MIHNNFKVEKIALYRHVAESIKIKSANQFEIPIEHSSIALSIIIFILKILTLFNSYYSGFKNTFYQDIRILKSVILIKFTLLSKFIYHSV